MLTRLFHCGRAIWQRQREAHDHLTAFDAPSARHDSQFLDADLLVAALDADNHLVLIADRHLQLHRSCFCTAVPEARTRALRRLLSRSLPSAGKYRAPSSAAIASGTARARQAAHSLSRNRRVIWGEAQPNPTRAWSKIFQAHHLFQFSIADPH